MSIPTRKQLSDPNFTQAIKDAIPGRLAHKFDDDCCCIHCGFDGAEWWHLEKHKPKADREPEPPCERT